METISARADRLNHQDTLDRSPFGHKTLFTFAKSARPKTGPHNQRRTIGAETVTTPDPSTFPTAITPGDLEGRNLKLVEADGIEPTTSSLQS